MRLVSGLALSAVLLAAPAGAEEQPAPASTALPVRPNRPLTLGSEAPAGGAGVRVALVLGALATGAWIWKRKGRREVGVAPPRLRVTARATVGLRSEVVIVEVDGQSLLVGVTPTSIQTLTTLTDGPPAEEVDGTHDHAPLDGLRARIDALASAAREKDPRSMITARTSAEPRGHDELQVAGLLRARDRNR